MKYCIEIGLPPGECNYNLVYNINVDHKVESVSGDISGNNATLHLYTHASSKLFWDVCDSWIRCRFRAVYVHACYIICTVVGHD